MARRYRVIHQDGHETEEEMWGLDRVRDDEGAVSTDPGEDMWSDSRLADSNKNYVVHLLRDNFICVTSQCHVEVQS